MAVAIAEARAEGGLPPVKALREFAPGDRVKARFEISAGSVLRRHDAGIDLMGDGRAIAFAGGVRRRTLDLAGGISAIDAVRRELTPTGGTGD